MWPQAPQFHFVLSVSACIALEMIQQVHKSTVQQRNWKFDLLAMFHVIVHKLLICETGIINQCKSLVSFSAVSTSEYMVYIPYQ